MKTGRIHMRIDEKLLEKTKKVARKRGVTLTQLIEGLLREVVRQEMLEKKTVEAEQI